MIHAIKILSDCEGTWHWACRQMQEGKTVYRLRDSGIVKFKYDEGQRKISAQVHWGKGSSSEWISMEDMFATDFKILPEKPNYHELHHLSQMKIANV